MRTRRERRRSGKTQSSDRAIQRLDVTGNRIARSSYFYVDGNLLSGAVPAVANPSPLAAATLCPNFLSTAPSANDLAWNQATGLYPDPWWSERHSRCDILFRQGFGYNE